MSSNAVFVKLLIFPAQLVLELFAIAIMFGWYVPRKLAFAFSAAGILAFILRGVVLFSEGWLPAVDFRHFWEAGRMVLNGIDPYTVPEQFNMPPFIYPPNGLPLSASWI